MSGHGYESNSKMNMKHILFIIAFVLMLPGRVQAQQNQMETLGVQYTIHPWRNARVAYFGDSITDPNNAASKKKYWGFLQDFLGITPYVYGISGREWNDIPRQTEQLKKEHDNDVDAILILCGTNDYNHHIPLGKWYEERDTMVYFAEGQPKALQHHRQRKLIECDSTFRGRINKALHLLKATYPQKQIVLLTPLHRGFFMADNTNVQPDESLGNSIGLYIDDYVNCVREAGSIWSVPVIDLYQVSGLLPLAQGSITYHNNSDLLHPNDTGHERLARTLVSQLLTLPCQLGKE
jgi:lysophospholipase L1-like esterase